MKKRASCFISYSYDSPEHMQWVKRLALKLRKSSVDTHIDQLDNHLGDDLVQYMVSAVGSSDRVIVICTPLYCQKLGGGAGFEKMLIGSELATDAMTNKFIPVLKEGTKATSIPTFLHSKLYINMPGNQIKMSNVNEITKAIRKRSTITNQGVKRSTAKSQSLSNPKQSTIAMVDVSELSRIKICGYTLLGGRGSDGIRYLWKTQSNAYTESIALNSRLKAYEISPEDKGISAYTTSVSFGCQLQIMGLSCSFCATGMLKYKGNLTAEEIAFQNIFMAHYDGDCPSWPEVRNHPREFAFMGQGEPGFCYPQVRRAILLTDAAMKHLDQKIHRYIIASSGIPEMLDILLSDLRSGVFQNKITLHFSLHALSEERTALMPINSIYDYSRFLKKTKAITEVTGEKVGIGILLFENYISRYNPNNRFTTTETYLDSLLDELDPAIHRIDLCDVNINRSINSQTEVSNERARALLKHVHKRRFQAKLFSSFGTDKNSGCGMLMASRAKIQTPGTITVNHFNKSSELLRKVMADVE